MAELATVSLWLAGEANRSLEKCVALARLVSTATDKHDFPKYMGTSSRKQKNRYSLQIRKPTGQNCTADLNPGRRVKRENFHDRAASIGVARLNPVNKRCAPARLQKLFLPKSADRAICSSG